jgi:hypothetical protein
MTHRRCHRRGRDGRDALFGWTRDGEIQPAEVVADNPLTRHCPRAQGGCGSPPMEPCTRVSRGRGRIRMTGYYHEARTAPVPPQPTEQAPSALVGARTAQDR